MHINVKKIFDWNIQDVRGPFTVYKKVDKAGNMQINGFNVFVVYRYHGARKFFFDVMSEKWWSLYSTPEFAAKHFAEQMRLKKEAQAQHQKTR